MHSIASRFVPQESFHPIDGRLFWDVVLSILQATEKRKIRSTVLTSTSLSCAPVVFARRRSRSFALPHDARHSFPQSALRFRLRISPDSAEFPVHAESACAYSAPARASTGEVRHLNGCEELLPHLWTQRKAREELEEHSKSVANFSLQGLRKVEVCLRESQAF